MTKAETVSLETAVEVVLRNGATFETIAGLCKMAVEAQQSKNDFHPDWDTVKAFDDRHNEDTALLWQLADALDDLYQHSYMKVPKVDKALAAANKRFTQPARQPCAGRNCGSTNPNLHSAECFEDYEKSTGMSEWKGLSEEEVMNFYMFWVVDLQDIIGFYKAVERKLKERNT